VPALGSLTARLKEKGGSQISDSRTQTLGFVGYRCTDTKF